METAHETLPLEERIRIRAYELYLQRGTQYGSAVGDWLQAEEEFRRASDGRHAVSESEFWRLVQLLSTEIEDAVTIFHTYEELNRSTLEDQVIACALNQDPLFWKVQRYCLQASLFIILGRIFDTAQDARSIHKVVSAMISSPKLFSATELTNRKRVCGFDSDALDQFTAQAWVPSSTAELRILRKRLTTHHKRFEQIYLPIRHAIFAHRLMRNDEAASVFFGATDRREIATMLDFLHDLIDAIQALYENGDEPVLGRRSYDQYNQRIRDGAQRVFRKLATPEN